MHISGLLFASNGLPMYTSLTKTKKYSKLEAHETLKRVASANAIIQHYKSYSLITVKRRAIVQSFLKVNLVTSYYNVINFLILCFTAPVIFTDTLDLCTFNFSLHCKLGESVNLQAVICMAVFGVFLFTVEQLVGNQDNVDWFSNIYNCRLTYCAKQTRANEDREKTVSMKVVDRKILTGSVPKSKLIIGEIVVNISKCNICIFIYIIWN